MSHFSKLKNRREITEIKFDDDKINFVIETELRNIMRLAWSNSQTHMLNRSTSSNTINSHNYTGIVDSQHAKRKYSKKTTAKGSFFGSHKVIGTGQTSCQGNKWTELSLKALFKYTTCSCCRSTSHTDSRKRPEASQPNLQLICSEWRVTQNM